MTFKTKLEIFEGPLDLLLHLIKINEVDISDVPIATITDQYLEYLDLMRSLDINVAGDFLVMASTLMHLKSKMLLPAQEQDLEEIEDLREEIIGPLREYIQLKKMADELASRDILGRDVFTRSTEINGISLEAGNSTTENVTLYQLMDAFRKIVKRDYPDVVLKFEAEAWSVKEKMEEIKNRLKQKKMVFFTDLFIRKHSIPEMIATFLALLELVKTGLIAVFQKMEGSDIMLKALKS
jgi:segregation and condensation protein A